MTLYFIDVNGKEEIIAEEIVDVEQAIKSLIEFQRTKYIFRTGKITFKQVLDTVHFIDTEGIDLGYILK